VGADSALAAVAGAAAAAAAAAAGCRAAAKHMVGATPGAAFATAIAAADRVAAHNPSQSPRSAAATTTATAAVAAADPPPCPPVAAAPAATPEAALHARAVGSALREAADEWAVADPACGQTCHLPCLALEPTCRVGHPVNVKGSARSHEQYATQALAYQYFCKRSKDWLDFNVHLHRGKYHAYSRGTNPAEPHLPSTELCTLKQSRTCTFPYAQKTHLQFGPKPCRPILLPL